MTKKKYQVARKAVYMDGELTKARKLYETIADTRASNAKYKLSDIFMSGLAMFSLKYHSLLDFDQQLPMERENLKRIFGVEEVCSDTHLRRVLDDHPPDRIYQFFCDRFEDLQETALCSAGTSL